jgi:hypothetical protein
MQLTYDGFCGLFPEFVIPANPPVPAQPPQPVIEMFLEVAAYYVDPCDFPGRMLTGKSLQYAVYLMTAHLYSLFQQRKAEADEGGTPGDAQGGWIQSASVGDVSVTKASLPAKDTWEFWLNSTPYGMLLLALLQGVSVGGLSVGGLPERSAFRKVYGVFL